MAVAAPARSAPSRAPARKPRRKPAKRSAPQRSRAKAAPQRSRAKAAPARRRQITPPGGHLIPLAVGRTAVAVRGVPDSNLMVRMTRGRSWIAVLCVLLTGIVGLNVVSLSIGATSSKVAQQTALLEQENSALRARIAQNLSSGKVADAAASLGMVHPDARDINFLNAATGDVEHAGAGGGSAPDSSTVATTSVPSTTTPTSTATAPPVTTTPTTTSTASTPAPVTTAPAPTAAAAAPAPTPSATVAPSSGSAGGVTSG